jgi:hypothetical protein
VRFELTALLVCNQFPWASRASPHVNYHSCIVMLWVVIALLPFAFIAKLLYGLPVGSLFHFRFGQLVTGACRQSRQ